MHVGVRGMTLGDPYDHRSVRDGDNPSNEQEAKLTPAKD